MADNLKIIYTDAVRGAATSTATSTATGFDAANTKLDAKIKTWRSTSLSAQTLTYTWASSQSIAGVALVFTNLIANSTVQIKLYTLAGDVSPVYDSGTKTINFAYPAPSGFSTINSTSFAYGGGNHWSCFFAETACKKMEIVINSSGNPDNFMEVSRVVAGKVWMPIYNVNYPLPVRWIDSTTSVRLDSGDHVAERAPMYRVMSLNMAIMRQADKEKLATIRRMNGSAVPIFVSAMPQAGVAEDEAFLQLYGRMSDELSIELFSYDMYQSQVDVVEI
jgi:hypothetical protein